MKGNINCNKNIPYGPIKQAIKKCTRHVPCDPVTPAFIVNLEKLNLEVRKFGLVVVPGEIRSRRIKLHDVTLVQEYYFGENLTWFNESRELLDIIFMDIKDIDQDIAYKFELLKNPEHPDNPDFDPIAFTAEILSTKRCWMAQVAGYKSNDPDLAKWGGVGLFIALRANKKVLADDSYNYNQDDM